MFRQTLQFVFIVVLALSIGLVAGESKKVDQHYVKIVTPEMIAEWEAGIAAMTEVKGPISQQNRSAVWSGVVGETGYDYGTNTTTGRVIAATSGGNMHITFMKRLNSATDQRNVTYNYADNSLQFMWGEGTMDESLGSTGWGRIMNGANDEAIMTAHVFTLSTWIYSDAGEANYAFSNMIGSGSEIFVGNYPGIAYGNGVVHFVGNSEPDRFTPDTYMYSTDYGATFVSGTYPEPVYDPNYVTGNTEAWPFINPTNPAQVNMVNTESDVNGVLPGAAVWYSSEDNGTTWDAAIIYDEDTWLDGGDYTYSYLVDNFSQINAAFTDDGTGHVAFNGYGVRAMDGDTSIAIFPVVYWNDATGELVEITDPAVGHNLDQEFSDAVLAAWPGNGLGHSYPNIATYGDNTIFVIWQAIEIGEDGLPVASLDIDGNPSAFYATDIEGAYSHDGGVTWTRTGKLSGRPELSDTYPSIAAHLWPSAENPDVLEGAYIYYQDADVGASINGQGIFAHGEWWYEVFEIPVTGIGDLIEPVASDFVLEQNYPNPFNPSTVISLQLAVSNTVSLSIYDTNGKLVTQLIDDQRLAANRYEIEWDGSDTAGQQVASGVYYYRLDAGNNSLSQTKKMLLVR